MKKFFKDFWNLQLESCRFLREHWVGYLILTAVLVVGEVLYFSIRYGVWCYDWIEAIWDKLTGIFTKA